MIPSLEIWNYTGVSDWFNSDFFSFNFNESVRVLYAISF